MGSSMRGQAGPLFSSSSRNLFDDEALDCPESPGSSAASTLRFNPNSPLGLVQPFVDTAVDAFFDNNLMFAVNYFLLNAKGSFGLVRASDLAFTRSSAVACWCRVMWTWWMGSTRGPAPAHVCAPMEA